MEAGFSGVERSSMLDGNVEKSRQRRSLPSPKRFAQAGRHFAMLTYSVYAPRVKQWLPPAGCSKQFAALLDDFFEHSRWLVLSALLWTFLC
jgi:hypothetical protein